MSHSLGFKNGLALRTAPKCAVGGMPLHYNNLSEEEMRTLANYNPTLTYGQARQAPPEEFVPAQVALDKKVCQELGLFTIIGLFCLQSLQAYDIKN